MEMKSGISPLGEVIMIEVIPYNKLLMVDLFLLDLQILSEMVLVMSG